MKWWFFYVSPVLFLFASCAEIPVPPDQLLSLLSDTSVGNDVFEQIPVHIVQDWDNKEITDPKNLLSSSRCPLFEVFAECPAAHTCQRTCATLNHGCVITPTCTSACFCREGFARDANNRCVPISECPGTTCPDNEEFIVCSAKWICEKTCAGRNSECERDAFCLGGCQCRPGYFRDTNGACVRAGRCVAAAVAPVCPHKEIWRSCAYSCTDQCSYNLAECIAASSGCSSGCFCDDGMARIFGRCMPRERCALVLGEYP